MKKKHEIEKIVLTMLLFSISASLFSGNVAFLHLDNRDGLSQINILSIYQDEIGAMWFGSTEGLNRYDGQKIQVFRPSDDGNGLSQNEIYKLCGNRKGIIYIRAGKDLIKYNLYKQKFINLQWDNISDICYHNDTLWVSTGKQILFYTEQSDQLQPFFKPKENIIDLKIYMVNDFCIMAGFGNLLYEIPKKTPAEYKIIRTKDEIATIYEDQKQNTWIGTSKNGIYKVTPAKDTIHYVQATQSNSLSDNQIRCIIEDNAGNIWVGTFYGLNKYDPVTDEWTNYTQSLNNEYSLSHNSIFALYKDEQGTIWVGTYFGGINYFSAEKGRYNIYSADANDIFSISYPFVGNMTEDESGNLWICTEGGGLNYFDRKKHTFTKYRHNEKNNTSIGHNNLKCIWYDRNNLKLYIGTYTGGLSIMDIRRKTFKTLKYHSANKYSLPNNIVNAMQYYKGNLILLTQHGLVKMDMEHETFSAITTDQTINALLSKQYTYETFLIDSQDRIWLSLSTGGLVCVDLRDNKVRTYHHNPVSKTGIGRFKVVKIFENSQRRLFFGSIGSGLFEYNPTDDSFIRYSVSDKDIMSNYCYYIAELPSKFLIILHNRGATFFNPETNKPQYSYDFPQQNFNQGSSIYITGNNDIFFGGNKGLASINEQLLHASSNELKLYFNQLIVNNREIIPNDGTDILSEAITFSKSIDLKHNQNNLIVNFATTEYVPTSYFNYMYKLEGFDDEWLSAPSNRQIIYTNLAPGNYLLKLKAVHENDKPAGEISLGIHISPPFYASLGAYIIYAILAALLLYFTLWFKMKQTLLKTSLEFERKDKERIELLNKTKLQFFTNISHEFRTPLTLIIGQAESLLSHNKFSPTVYNCVLKLYKNAMQLRELITELMDFRKQEQGYLNIKAERNDIVAFTKEIYLSFCEYALKKNIRYRFEHPGTEIDLWFDPVQLQKVIYNLISNAFKYTKQGEISVGFVLHANKIDIIVKDTGTGISNEHIDKIFDSFYQIEPDGSSEFTMGTGIGLALSKGIVELHKGHIRVESEPDKGSTFIVTLLLGNAHLTEEQMRGRNEQSHVFLEKIDINDLQLTMQEICTENEIEAGGRDICKKPVILLVEDNVELLDMLEDIFKPLYTVYRAINGKEGLEQTRELQPNIVLSDVMMPEMSGKEMCYKIKNDVSISHIPVVLLTAQTSVEYTLEGFMFGADDYITKPFNIKILISRCNNLVKSRKILLDKIKNTDIASNAAAETLNECDRKLIEKITSIIHTNFDNSEFNMNDLATQLGMGRSKLYLKMKEVTGLTPNEFTLKLKMNEGMRLLSGSPHLSISEISYTLGFSSARYFSQSFKSFYGIAPANVRKQTL